MRIKVKVNGQSYEHEVEPRLLLVDYVRDVVGLKGTHFGCDTTSCGACTVVVDGLSAKSCTLFAVQADGKEIFTIEGLARDGELHPIQEAFWTHHALQCGFCTSGMVMSAYFLLSRNPHPSEVEIKQGIAGNLCRCTGYLPIVEAVKSAARKLSSWKETS
ncbi:MAG TPA: (2Fe-2S)-binding protein [Candidatus Binatia bacterium]|nr:(2Fe-2S)-binding protein [Candidatus Binatia bacterium]